MSVKNLIIFGLCIILSAAFFVKKSWTSARQHIPSSIIAGAAINENVLNTRQQSASQLDQPGIGVPILVYHNITPDWAHESVMEKRFSVTPDMLDKQFQYLKDNGYTAVGFDAISDYFASGKALPSKPVIITFDDGWHPQYVYAFPLLKKYGFTATFFVFSNAIDYRHYMTTAELREMAAAGMTIGGHSRSHPYLGKITDQAALEKEIVQSKKVIEDVIGARVDFFAYPFGQYNDHIIEMVKSAGYKAARGLGFGAIQSQSNIYTLKAMLVPNDLQKFIWEVNIKK